MQLTQLEIKGFKSFGDKITINFDAGITAVVGPNGCGKSNVVDAIRWVLGEQSTKALRSEKMENIIFNGTRTRKASNLAEVSLSFNNTKNILPTEYNNVTITRKLYRTGESEYRLNGVVCRLKDITDLFLDTGIGPDNYAIIELKMIEEILSNKDNSRRTLFEEAAGIGKYKIRKKQTLSKLNDTETDLARVMDLLFEIEKNLKTLENQAKKTERYYKLKEKYKETSLQYIALLLQNTQTNMETVQENILVQSTLKAEKEAEINTLSASIETEKLATLTAEKNLQIQQKATNEHIQKINNYENEKKIKNERLTNLKDKENKSTVELNEDKALLIKVEDNIASLKKTLEVESDICKSLEKDLNFKKEALANVTTESSQKKINISQKRQAQTNKATDIQKLERGIEINKAQIDTLTSELNRNTADATRSTEEANAIDTAIQAAVTDRDSKANDLELISINLSKYNETLEGENDTLKKIGEQLRIEQSRFDTRNTEYGITKRMVENLEGYPESIKYLKKNAEWAKNTPLLSDILFCEADYRVCIENFLQPYMNYYVVEKYTEAIDGIELLSKADKGKANFFVLEAFKSLSAEKTLTLNGTTAATEVVKVEAKYEKMCSYLLKNVHITKESILLDTTTEAGHTLLSQSGKITRSALSLSGGSVGLFEGQRIGRAKNMEQMQKDLEEISAKIMLVKASMSDKEKEIVAIKEKIKSTDMSAAQKALSAAQNNYSILTTKKEQLVNLLKSTTDRKATTLKKIEELSSNSAEIEPNLKALRADYEAEEEAIKTLQTEINTVIELQNNLNNAYNTLNINTINQKNKVDNLEKDIAYKSNEITSLNNRISFNTKELSLVKEQILSLVSQDDLSDDELRNMYAQKTDMELGLKESEEGYNALKIQIFDIEKRIGLLRSEKDYIDNQITALKENENNLKVETAGVTERLSVEFEIDINDVDWETIRGQLKVEGIDQSQAKQSTEKQRTQINEFGAINPLALEAYAEMDERYKFISTQVADLNDAKKSLLNTIAEIDTTALSHFTEAFDKVRANFIIVFRSLFNEEDSCDIILQDPNNPLESAIEIIAKPKGKRPLSINQLSGGEKTLTATAILFSLYLLKPAPFCIFDEVDAPLDDTNIDKFNNIIRKFSDQSQFIIVSHNKRTIASTDVVYGVTMVEQGVSCVVPVDLRQVA